MSLRMTRLEVSFGEETTAAEVLRAVVLVRELAK
jgi:hypothetical protein